MPLTPKATDLLLALVESPGQLLDKDALLKTVWPDTFVEENNLADNIFKLRRALGDGENGQKFIETIPKRGYRFVAGVRLVEPPPQPGEPAEPGSGSPRKWIWAAVGALAIVSLVWAGASWKGGSVQPGTPLGILRSSLLPPADASFGHVALSPDGKWLAFTATTGSLVQLWLRPMDGVEAKRLEGTEGASLPFWSPDSKQIAFFSRGKLRMTRPEGGPATELCNAATGTGGTWNQQSDILFTTLGNLGIWRVSSSGGAPEIALRAQSGQTDLHEPHFLQDGRHFLYLALSSGAKESQGLYVASLDGMPPRRILEHTSNAVFVPAGSGSGYLLLGGRDGGLTAQPFDARTLQLAGDPVSIAPRLGTAHGQQTSYRRRNFTASSNGLLVYDPLAERQRVRMVWVNRRGKTIQELSRLDNISAPMLSPDDSRIIVSRKDLLTNDNDLWLTDARGDHPVRFTFDPGSDLLGIWSPDGQRIVWSTTRNGHCDLYEKEVNGQGHDAPLLRTPQHKFVLDWSRNGRYLLYREIFPDTQHDVYVLPMSGIDRRPFPYLKTKAMENGATLSPNSRWIAYSTDESGRLEVYVESFPEHGGRRQISLSGGSAPRWRADGRELYYQTPDGQLMAVPAAESASALTTGKAEALFSFRPATMAIVPSYAPARDGQRFLISAVVEPDPKAPLTLLLNWAPQTAAAR